MILLLLDLGNTSLNLGVYQDRKPLCFFRTYADRLKSESEYVELLAQFFSYHGISPSGLDGAIMSSVVPSLTRKISQAADDLLGRKCLLVSKSIHSGIALRIDNPSELGSDFICESVGAADNFRSDCLVVDMGTATKFFVVTAAREFLGCAIAPGIQLSSQALWKNAALLTDVELKYPGYLIGRNSDDSMNAGIVFGHAAMIKGMCQAIEKEAGRPLRKILTGGDALLVRDLLGDDYLYAPYLIFDGLYDIFLRNAGKEEKKI